MGRAHGRRETGRREASRLESSREQSYEIRPVWDSFAAGIAKVTAERTLSQHVRVHSRLVRLAERRLSRREYSAALAYAQAAAEYAWRCPTGAFASPALERVVSAVRTATLDSTPDLTARPIKCESPQQVLHVLTRAEEIGGHTRLCWRWMRADSDRQHTVVLTGPGKWAVPAELAAAAAEAGGTLDVLDEKGADLLDRARALRELADKVDLIVLHVSPYDVVPLLALGDPLRRPPAVFLNHSDHVFWLGLGVSDVVAHLRPSGATLSRDRRAVTSDRSAMLPLPLSASASAASRAIAREQLGVPDRACLLLTIATPQKYDVDEGTSMVAVLAPVLARFPDSVLIAVGPRQEGVWAAAGQRHAGRVRAVGIQDDISSYLAAADIYLDSFPMTSLTSLLEAGQHGLPLLRLASPDLAGASPLSPDDPAMQDALVTVPDAASYRAQIVTWLSDPRERARLGQTAKRSIVSHHCGEHWQRRVEAVYAQAALQATMRPSTSPYPPEPPHLRTEYDLELVDMSSRGGVDVYFVRRLFDHCALLPRRRALEMAVRFIIAMRDDFPSIFAQRRRIGKRMWRSLKPAKGADLGR